MNTADMPVHVKMIAPKASLSLVGARTYIKNGALTLRETAQKGRRKARRLCCVNNKSYVTHVYLTVKLPRDALAVRCVLFDVINEARKDFPLLVAEMAKLWPHRLKVAEPADLPSVYHVSLSRVTSIRYPTVDPLIASLTECLAGTTRFEFKLAGLEVFTNVSRTCSFLALSVGEGRQQVRNAIACVNEAFALHSLPKYYRDPKPHCSIAWVLGDEEEALQVHIREVMRRHSHGGVAGRDVEWLQQVTSIECQIGPNTYRVWPDDVLWTL